MANDRVEDEEFFKLWALTTDKAEDLGLSLHPQVYGLERFRLYDGESNNSPVFQSTRLEECLAFIDGVSWERAPRG